MNIRLATIKDLEAIYRVALQWKATCNGDALGMKIIDSAYLADIASLINDADKDLLLLVEDAGEIVGYMGMNIFINPLGDQKIFNEHYFFILPKYRGISSVRMIKSAKQWAKSKGCTHMLITASSLANSYYERICCFYEKLKFKEFERTYIATL